MLGVSDNIIRERYFVNRCPRNMYRTKEEVLSIADFFECRIEVFDKEDLDVEAQLKRFHVSIGQKENCHNYHAALNGYFVYGTDAIVIMSNFGKYIPTGVLFHEIGHLLHAKGITKRGCNFADFVRVANVVQQLADTSGSLKDVCEGMAWAYGIQAAIKYKIDTGTDLVEPCLDQLSKDAQIRKSVIHQDLCQKIMDIMPSLEKRMQKKDALYSVPTLKECAFGCSPSTVLYYGKAYCKNINVSETMK